MTPGRAASLHPRTVTRVWRPGGTAAAAVHSIILRDTSRADLTPAQRLSHGGARGLCAIHWERITTPELATVWRPDDPAVPRRPLPMPVHFAGCASGPWLSFTPGPSRSLTVLLYPDAVSECLGFQPGGWIDRHTAFDARLVSRRWLDWSDAVLGATWDDDVVPLIVTPFRPGRYVPPGETGTLTAWQRGFVTRLKAASRGLSARVL